MKKVLFVVLLVASAFPGVPSAGALAAGLVFALVTGGVFPAFSKKASRFLLQAAVVGIGFGMNFNSAIRSGGAGMAMTVVSVVFVMFAGWALGRMMRVDGKVSYLVSAGTAICGGSAIAAVGPVIKADDDQMSISLATIFILNAIALFIFPPIGEWIGLSQQQFGMWAAIAIHDTSSVVGAGAAYGEEALKVATTVKLTRALWIIPLAIASSFIFRSQGRKISIPWFILLFVVAMVLNTFLPIPEALTGGIVMVSRKILCMTLFLIGSGLSVASIKKVGVKPLGLGVLLWFIISVVTLLVVSLT